MATTVDLHISTRVVRIDEQYVLFVIENRRHRRLDHDLLADRQERVLPAATAIGRDAEKCTLACGILRLVRCPAWNMCSIEARRRATD